MKILFKLKDGNALEVHFDRVSGASEDEVLAELRGQELVGVEVHGKRARVVEEDEVQRFRLVERRIGHRRIMGNRRGHGADPRGRRNPLYDRRRA